MPDINGIPYVDPSDLVSAYPATSQALAQELSDQLASKLDYPTGGSDGDLLAKDGTSAEWIAVPEAGLTLITSESFSAVSSVSVNGCFTTTYRFYRLVFRSAQSNVNLRLRYRASGADNTATQYIVQNVRGFGSTAGGVSLTDNYLELSGSSGTLHWGSADIIDPATAVNTLSVCTASINQPHTALVGAQHNVQSAFDGLTLFPASGNMTGIIKVYGYKD